MAKQLLMTPKAISDRKRLEAKKNGTYQPRKLSQSKDNVRKREKYHRERHHWLAELTEVMKPESEASVDFNTVVNTEPPKEPEMLAPLPNLDKLSRKELKKLILESIKTYPIPLKIREPGDPNVTQILHTDLARLISDSQSLKDANKQVEELTKFKIDLLKEREDTEAQNEALKAQQSTDMATIQSKNQEIATLKSEIQTARRQRDDANAYSKILSNNLEAANELIKKNNDSRVDIDRKISDFNIKMGELNRIAIRWKFVAIANLFCVTVPAIFIASAAIYILTHR